MHIVMASLPKSSTVYTHTALVKTLDLTAFDLCPQGMAGGLIHVRALEAFIDSPRSIGGEHFRALRWNMNLLHFAGVRKLLVLVRDPRDAVVSWWHHLERPDIKGWKYRHAGAIASGTMTENYDLFTPEQKLDVLIEGAFRQMQTWLREWAAIVDGDLRFECHVVRYEDFITDQRESISGICRFYGHAGEPTLPEIEKGEGIQATTHFRRGEAGSHRDEMTAPQLARVNALTDTKLFARFGWAP